MTIAMLALAGIPATAGFIGKFYLIDAAVSGGYTWLGVVIVVGSMISLGYYLPVVAAMWMRDAPGGAGSPRARPPGGRGGGGALPALAGGSPELDGRRARASEQAAASTRRSQREVLLVALLAGAGTIFFGIIPQPLFDLVHGTGQALGLLYACQRALRPGPPPRAASSASVSWRSTRSSPRSQKPGSDEVDADDLRRAPRGFREPPAASSRR